MNVRVRLSIVSAMLLLLVACVPTHTIKPLPNFVKAGLEPGDTIIVTTHSGKTQEFVITEIRGDSLIGDSVQFDLKNLASIKKQAWSRPKSPCGGEKSLGCSVPFLVGLASESHSHYKGIFYDACAQHDYCYRHGFSSYGMDRELCDEEFLQDMKNLCPDPAVGKLGKVFEALDGSVDSRQTCETVANDYYAAVRRYGEEKFLTTNSSYCEYNGAPLAPPSAPRTPPSAAKSP